ncbi:MAG: hypothetical protein HC869_02135, partial [Rhodospirillales bacterium]|nr:hypothetical protein [Rhodospirillales bacterium]
MIPSVQRPSARGWVEGSDPARLVKACDRIEMCGYEPTVAMLEADLFQLRRLTGPEARLNAILRPSHPDLAGGAAVGEAVQALRA